MAWVGQAAPNYQQWRQQALDLAVNDLGLNRLRVELPCGMEKPTPLPDPGSLGEGEINCLRYSTINDDDDPNHVNQAGFQFADLDKVITEIVLPVRQLLETRGETLHVNFCYVAFTGVLERPPCDSNLQYDHRDPDEYAEFVTAVCRHVREKFGFVPDTWEFLLEADNRTGWTGTQIGRAIAKAGARLRAAGINTTFVAPSVTNIANAVPYFDEMVAVPGAIDYVSEFSYHRYGGGAEVSLRRVADKARQYNVETAMLEHIGSGYEDLHTDLKVANVSSWEQYTICGSNPGDPGGRYYLVDATKPPGSQLRIASRTPYLRQYFRYIRKGAVRIGVSTTNSSFDPVAFVNRDDGNVVVVKAAGAGSFGVAGLPAGVYGISYNTGDADATVLPDVVLAEGQTLQTSIPGKGAITIFAKGSVNNRARITSCQVKQTSSGASVLVVTGENLRAGATATIGGVVPRKVKFKREVSPGEGVYTQMILKGGICGGLPGAVVITNPGVGASDPFQVQQDCP